MRSKYVRPELGARVTFEAVLERRFEGNRVWWVEVPVPEFGGWYAGMRTVYNGKYQSGSKGGIFGEEVEGPELYARVGVTHALVIVGERAELKRVPFSALRGAVMEARDPLTVYQKIGDFLYGGVLEGAMSIEGPWERAKEEMNYRYLRRNMTRDETRKSREELSERTKD